MNHSFNRNATREVMRECALVGFRRIGGPFGGRLGLRRTLLEREQNSRS